jgi:hypothetical protein
VVRFVQAGGKQIMRTRLLAAISPVIVLCSGLRGTPAVARESADPRRDALGRLYARLSADLVAGKPLVATIYVALCDNDAQGIVKVKRQRLCRGDDPDRNLYWAAAGGLLATLRAARWQRVSLAYFADGNLAVKAVWRKRFTPAGQLRAKGVLAPFDAFIVGLGYRGSRIREAMMDYLRAVNRDDPGAEAVGELGLSDGGASHVVGYIGHDYFYDVDDWQPLLALRRGDSTLPKGAFALSCTGHRLIRPAIQRDNVHILLLNRTLGFPGAWTAEAIVTGIASGLDARAIYRGASAAFASGQGVPLGVALASFAWGD